jgi:hypothetical protein
MTVRWTARFVPALIAFVVGFSCVDRAYEVEDYGACGQNDECNDEATCVRGGPFDVCRPNCEQDSDCPEVDGISASCGLGGEVSGQCVLPCGNCPDGMICVGVASSPTSPLACVWES